MSDNIATLFSVVKEMGHIKDFNSLLEEMLDVCCKHTQSSGGTIYIYNQEHHRLNAHHSQKEPLGKHIYYHHEVIPLDSESLVGLCTYTREILSLNHSQSAHQSLTLTKPLNNEQHKAIKFNPLFDKNLGYDKFSSLTLPIVDEASNSLIAVIQLLNTNMKLFSPNHVDFVTKLASLSSLFISTAYAAHRLLLRMVAMTRLRDPSETALHVNRVSNYSVFIYEKWAATQDNISGIDLKQTKDALRLGAILHDIGKIAISDSILKKPAKLTADEFAIMKSHTWLGASLFRDALAPFEFISYEIILNHHENWDGSGYPGFLDEETLWPSGQKKAGNDIPIVAQIVALVDVFDALTSSRVYKQAWSIEKAVEEIVSLSGKKFNPALVQLLVDNLIEIETIGQQSSRNYDALVEDIY